MSCLCKFDLSYNSQDSKGLGFNPLPKPLKFEHKMKNLNMELQLCAHMNVLIFYLLIVKSYYCHILYKNVKMLTNAHTWMLK